MENPVCSNPEDFFGNKYNTKSNNLIIIKVTQDNLICLTRNELKIILSLPTIEYSEDEEKIYNSKFWFYRLPQNDIWIDHTLKDAYDNRVNTMKIVSMSNLDGVGLHDPLTPYFQVKPISRKTLFEENNDEKYTIFSDSGNEDEIIEKNISKEETKKNLEWKSKSKLQLEMYDKPTQDWQKIARNKYNRKESLEIWKLGQNFMDFLHLQRMFLNNILFGTPDYGAYLYPDSQPFVNDKFESFACWGYLSSVKWMLSPECEVKPDQETMNCTLIRASRRGANAVVRWLLNQPAESLRPDQQAINKAYDILSEDVCYKAPEDPLNYSMNMTISLLRPFVVR